MLNTLLEKTCEKQGDKTAVHFFEKKYTYNHLKNLTQCLASSFIHLNIQPNDKIAFFLTNRPEAILCFTAAFKIGATVVPINQFFESKRLESVFNEIRPKILITEKKLLPELLKIPKEILENMECYLTDDCDDSSLKMKSFNSLIDQAHLISCFPEVQTNKIATISFTSGSTGNPKGVMHTQLQLYNFLVNHAKHAKYRSEDHVLIYVPLAFGYSFSNQILTSLYSGATISLVPAGDYEKVVDTIQNNKVTLMYVGPTSFIHILNILKSRPQFDHCLRAIISAGDAMPMALHKRASALLNVTIYEGIGMTETWLYALNPLDDRVKIGSLGVACADIEIKIVNEYRQEVPCGQVGQITVKGNSVMQGYYLSNKDDIALENSWFYTGDFGYLDQDGYIFYCGRKESWMIKNNSPLFPHEIEFAFYEHPAVREAGVICGDTIIAFVSLNLADFTVSKEHLFEHLKKYLAVEKIPDEIIMLPQLPKGITGKIDRKLLRLNYEYYKKTARAISVL